MMKTLLTLATLAIAGTAQADPMGIWQTEPGDTGGFLHVQIEACGSNVCGTITRAFDKDLQVVEDYEHGGKPIIWDMAANGDNAWAGGKIWAPDRNKTYKSKMSLNGDNLKVEGCVAIICRAQTWRRVR